MTRANEIQIVLRIADEADIPVLASLIDRSVRGLQHKDYTQEQLDSALRTVYGVDSQLIADQTYFVAETTEEPPQIVGCGGWSKRKTLYGGDHWSGREDALLDPNVDAAKIRAFFIDPKWARLGIGSRILEACEDAASDQGFKRFEMGATLTGVAFYKVKGYLPEDSVEVPLEGGLTLPILRMSKAIP